tara:strand:+ start:654 stop:782 length:129 start_codon:yes stop_codon:yes gene_type:complete
MDEANLRLLKPLYANCQKPKSSFFKDHFSFQTFAYAFFFRGF